MDFALRSCSWHGHATYAPSEPELARRLRADTAAGEAWRCLRCEGFIVGPAHGSGPADQAPAILRGKLLKDRFIMRLLAVERIVRTVIFTLLSVGVFRVRAKQAHLHDSFERELPLIRPLAHQIGWNLDDSKLIKEIDKAFSLSPTSLRLIALGLLTYAVIELVEAAGLWLGQRWGEYFAVVATSVFLPLEVYELTEKVTAFKVAAFAINVVAVLWLLWSKRLFGLHGGGKAYRDEHSAESLLTVERAAAPA